MLDFYRFDYIRVGGVISREFDGIADAHVNAAGYFRDTPFIILEDDCLIYKWQEYIDIPDDADIVYLGNHGYKLKANPTDLPGVWKSDGMYGCHAILYLTNKGVELLKLASLQSKEKLIGFDDSFYLLHKEANVYLLDEPVWYQKDVPDQTAFKVSQWYHNGIRYGGSFPDYEYPILLGGTGQRDGIIKV